ncbi:hypothetical protein [Croceitalea rosinachiae]|uniref:Uncharacterized protein n=1 Tax=Croceitalea rosinachiae TaxID=3075596 RepID=A0ABU3A9R7_9FLAO|nr:hypothetical protein [Croceitalea sp. F388]MDT0606545.1 hypothetical protein [Croceitalea sp. F388]
MCLKTIISLFLFTCTTNTIAQDKSNIAAKFQLDKDLLLVHYDCKTDVDDLHSAAAFVTMLSKPKYLDLNYFAVGGTYGMQNGLYVPPNSLFDLAFGKRWVDAHNAYDKALKTVTLLSVKALSLNGNIWIAEGGQSDFTFDIIKTLRKAIPNLDTKRIHVIQHSDWNEEVTTPEKLDFIKSAATYHKIPDGNSTQNGTPGFRSEEVFPWAKNIKDKHLAKVWELAIQLGNQYNGLENRYLNKAIEKGGLDFSDFAEVCWILGLEKLEDTKAYFEFIAEKD